MYFLVETCSGYALVEKHISDSGLQNFSLSSFLNFETKRESLNSCFKLIKGKIPKNLKNFLVNNSKKNSPLIINDYRLLPILSRKIRNAFSKIIVKKFYFREIRQNLINIFNKNILTEKNKKTVILAQSIYRSKLKINGAKVDNFLSQTIRILDELDNQLNVYSVRLKEWYGWHFPELSGLVSDNITYARCVERFETRDKLKNSDLSGLLDKNLVKNIVEASEISSGVKIFRDDLDSILSLCNQIISIDYFRNVLNKYLKNRMYYLAPNLSSIVGEKVGARLISHCGSLLNLSKCPSSKIQIFGAEKALFKALKTHNPTPKFGIIFNAKIINTCDINLSGKVSRIVSAKSSLCSRIDALGDYKFGGSFGIKNKIYLEKRIRQFSSLKHKLNTFK
jgi:nucleolar protein 58